jgi:Cdc6-like AAA superfamily ATPase
VQDKSIIEKITDIINAKGPHLVILEAAAGFGKTCTAYEVLKEIVCSDDKNNIPIFAELSRNRKASVFKYVLLDEIDRLFHYLKSDLVIYEIIQGRIPLIIDGFDELITKSNQVYSKHGANYESEAFDDIVN